LYLIIESMLVSTFLPRTLQM